jgi:hypothetical protein
MDEETTEGTAAPASPDESAAAQPLAESDASRAVAGAFPDIRDQREVGAAILTRAREKR